MGKRSKQSGNTNRVVLEDFGGALADSLTLYVSDVQDRINKIGRASINEVARITKDTAPFNARAYHRHYADMIATRSERGRLGDEVHIWYVKAPAYRLTHLLVHGHETKDGGRTRADPFLKNALGKVLPEYEAAIERTLKNGK